MVVKFYGKKSVATSTDFLATSTVNASGIYCAGSGRKIWPPYGIDFLFLLHLGAEDLFISLPGN